MCCLMMSLLDQIKSSNPVCEKKVKSAISPKWHNIFLSTCMFGAVVHDINIYHNRPMTLVGFVSPLKPNSSAILKSCQLFPLPPVYYYDNLFSSFFAPTFPTRSHQSCLPLIRSDRCYLVHDVVIFFVMITRTFLKSLNHPINCVLLS